MGNLDFEVEFVEGFAREAPPLFASYAPVLGFVEKDAGMGWASEIVSRGDAGMFDVGGKEGDDFALGFEAVEHAALAGGGRGVEEEDFVGDAGVEELAGFHPGGALLGGAVVIGSEFEQDRDGKAFAAEQAQGGMNAEGGGIMIGVAAFIGMGIDGAGPKVGDKGSQKTREAGEMEGSFLVDGAALD